MEQKPAVLVTVSRTGQVTVTAHRNITEACQQGNLWQTNNDDNPNWIATETEC